MVSLHEHRTGLLALALLGALALAGCGQSAAPTGPIHLRDDTGVSLTLKAPVTRIVSLGPSNTEILLALGLRKDIVGIDDESQQYAPPPYSGEVKGLKIVGDSYNGLNVEKIVALRPQLILAMPDVKNASELKALKMPYATLSPSDLQGIYQDIRFVGEATGESARAGTLVAQMQKEVAAIKAAVQGKPQPSVFVELDPSQYYTAGPGSFLDALVQTAGGRNIADPLTKTPYPALSAESIITADPQVIVLLDTPYASSKSVAARPGWSEITAVKSGRVYQNINPDFLSQPAPAIVEGLKELAQDLHPGLQIP